MSITYDADKKLDELIEKGESLESEAENGMVGKFFKSTNFEKWLSASIFFLENNYDESAITKKAVERFKEHVNSNNSYELYQFILGSLEAIKSFQE